MSFTTNERDDKFYKRLQTTYKTVKGWDENPQLLEQRRNDLPWEFIRTGKWQPNDDERFKDLDGSVAAHYKDHSHLVTLQRLVRWFQKSMTWVNAPPCVDCSSTNCTLENVRGPETEEEKSGLASRVEVYRCGDCNSTNTTFPRYNSVAKLRETAKGRCGEYANLFGLTCRAAGFETRYVLDVTDHVWTEVYVPSLEEWIMVDGCEGIINEPGMYEHGWGKKGLCYMVALGMDHVIDVTPKYTRNFMTEELQLTRRNFTSSETISTRMLDHFNNTLQTNLTQARRDELRIREEHEKRELQLCQQSTSWDREQQYNLGRISGSLEWKQTRQEDGSTNDAAKHSKEESKVYNFQVESFLPLAVPSRSPEDDKEDSKPSIALSVYDSDKLLDSLPRHGKIQVSSVPCAVETGEGNENRHASISVVVVDESPACFGCILQSKAFETWTDLADFVAIQKSNRIIVMNGKYTSDKLGNIQLLSQRLGGWEINSTKSTKNVRGTKELALQNGFVYVGMVDAHPDWAVWKPIEEIPSTGYEIELRKPAEESAASMKLRTERATQAKSVAGRLPESVMPLATQLLASEEQKRVAFLNYCLQSRERKESYYSGYTTKQNSPVYLLGSTSFPFQPSRSASGGADAEGEWNTFHFLPDALVPDGDEGILVKKANDSTKKAFNFDIPLETNHFESLLGSVLLTGGNEGLPTEMALHNTRLIGLYFSAHWCGPCRRFTPMLAEMYSHLKEEYPTHGLEIVFVSSDRDQQSFDQYFGTMPWTAIPFDMISSGIKQRLSATYGVRGIPAFVILDAISGQVVVPGDQSRSEVMTACQRGDDGIESLLESWCQRIPAESQEIMRMLELSCEVSEKASGGVGDSKPNPYLCLETPIPIQKPMKLSGENIKARVKEMFTMLIGSGADPTAAAAQAIEAVAAEKDGRAINPTPLAPGPLHGSAVRRDPTAADRIKKPVDAVHAALSIVVSSNTVDDAKTLLKTGLKYVENCSKQPCNPKFRVIKLSNKVADRMFRSPGSIRLLKVLGLEIFGTNQDFVANIPLATDLPAMVARIQSLLERLDTGNEDLQ